MSDWRLYGQEAYLTGFTFYKVSFPGFWKKAYEEKNPFFQAIECYAKRYVENHKKGHEYLEGDKMQIFWHEHCEFCWDKATTDRECTFYCTEDLRYWVCEECFRDFKDRFRWTEKPGESLFAE